MSAPLPPPPPQWVLDLNSTSTSKPKGSAIPDPPGYTSNKQLRSNAKAPAPRKPPTAVEMDTLKLKKAWELAFAPAKQLPMNAIGMYMSGSSLQIFSIMMVFMLFKTPVTSIFSIQRAFAPFSTPTTSSQLVLAKIAYIITNLMQLALGIWKVNQMGLLPTTRSDWLAWEEGRTALETAFPAS